MKPDTCTLFQGFSQNGNAFYKQQGLCGHPGLDTGCGYGSTITSPVSGRVCGLYTPERPARDGYVAVYLLVKTTLETFELSVGHCSKVLVQVGDIVKKGDPIALEGNKGIVYVGGTQITLVMQKAGDKRGSHRHWQKRVVVEVAKRRSGGNYLRNASGYVRTPSGGYYEWALPDNCHASCIDMTLPLWPRNLSFGSTGYDVQLLQRLLGVIETGYYGALTHQALNSYQLRHGLDQGPCGPKTRAHLNKHYGQLEDSAEPVVVPPDVVEELVQLSEAVAEMEPDAREGFSTVFSGFLRTIGLIK